MVGFMASLPAKWAEYLKRLADDHEINLNNVISELCEWAFSGPASKEQFEDWLDEAYPPKGEAEGKANAAGEEEEDEAEEESPRDPGFKSQRTRHPPSEYVPLTTSISPFFLLERSILLLIVSAYKVGRVAKNGLSVMFISAEIN